MQPNNIHPDEEIDYEQSIDQALLAAKPENFLGTRINLGKDLTDVAVSTYFNKDGTVLSAISDRAFIRKILKNLMPLQGKRVFEIGSGLGHLSSVISELCGPDGEVIGCEIIAELFYESQNNPSIIARRNLKLYEGDFINITPELGVFDVIIGTSSFSRIPGALLNSLNANGGLIAIPIEIPGGGDCMTVFRRQASRLQVIAAHLSISVPTQGAYSEKPFWAGRVYDLIPQWDALVAVKLELPGSASQYSIRATLPFRSNLLFFEKNFAALNLAQNHSQALSEGNMAFGLISESGSAAVLQQRANLILKGSKSMALAACFTGLHARWLENGKQSLADIRYILDIDALEGDDVLFTPGYGVGLFRCEPEDQNR